MVTAVRATEGSWRPHLQAAGKPRAAIRILTVDQHSLVLEGLACIINNDPEMTVVAKASNGRDAIARFRECQPEVVTIDLLLPDMPGEAVVTQILAEFRDARIVVITGTRGDVDMLRALEAGAQGFVLKQMPSHELLAAIRQVHAGKKMIPRQVASALAEHLSDDPLTPREIQVLRLVSLGNRNKEVAALLSIADETVRMHMKNILSKLCAQDRTHAVIIALKRGVFRL